jgi:arylsulfatase A-like enzyme
MANDSTETTPELIRRAAMGVLGFAVAISLVHLGQGIGLILALGMPPLTLFAGQSIFMELALALAVGLPLAVVYKLPRGEWIFPVLATLAFIVIERIVAVDPSKLQMWIAPSVVGFVVFLIGRALWRWKPPVVVGLALGLPVVFLALPLVAESMRDEPVSNVKQGEPKPGAPDVLMIVMDTVRAQSVHTYGYERDTTPVLDQLGAEGVVFEDANAPATWSLPAHAALFTGTFPSKNQAHGETRYLEADPALPTLADQLALEGWETWAFSANPHISDSFGLTRGFMHNDKAWMAGTSGRNFSFIYRVVDALGIGGVDDKGGATVIGNISRWMDARPADDRPAFVFVNFLEAHFPFRQLPAEYRNAYQSASMNTLREIDQIAFGVQFGRQLTDEEMAFVHQPLIDLYDGGVKYTDFLVGQVIDEWRKAGRLDNTVVVVLGDHGEVVGEHGAFGHVTPVVEQDLRVPLVLRYPARIPAGTRVAQPVSTVGVFDTIMDLAGGRPSPVTQVKTLMPVVEPPTELRLTLQADGSVLVGGTPTAPEGLGPAITAARDASDDLVGVVVAADGAGQAEVLALIDLLREVGVTRLSLEGPGASDDLVATAQLPPDPRATVGLPILAERYEEEMLAARFAPGTANGEGPLVNPTGRYRTYRSGHYKFVQYHDDGVDEEYLFDLAADPGELNDIADAEYQIADQLRDELDAWLEQLGLPSLDAEVDATEREMSKEECEALVALGYLEPPCPG